MSSLYRCRECGAPAIFQATVVLRGSPLKGATTVKVCEAHRQTAGAFCLNDENRNRLANHLIIQGFCDAFTAYGMVKHNAAVEFDRIAS